MTYRLQFLMLPLILIQYGKAMDSKKAKVDPESYAQEHTALVAEVHLGLNNDMCGQIRHLGELVCEGFPVPLRHVTILSLEGCKLTALPDSFHELTALKKLSLKHNGLAGLFPKQWAFPALEDLDISDTLVGTRPVTWSGFFALRKLTAQRAHIAKLEDTFGNLHRLEHFDVSHNALETINSMLFLHVTLRVLNLAHNRLTRVSAEIANLYNLTELYLDGNALKNVPEQLGSLKQLEVLSLRENHLRNIPQTIGTLTHLRVLYLSKNKLREFPAFLCVLKHLEALYFDENECASLSSGLQDPPLHELFSLQILSLAHNKLSGLPHTISFLENLVCLVLSYNHLKIIPWELSKLTSLREVRIDHNEIRDLRPDFFENVPLEKLALGGNPIPDLPTLAHELKKKMSVVLIQ